MIIKPGEKKTDNKHWAQRELLLCLIFLAIFAAMAGSLIYWWSGELYASGRLNNSPVSSPTESSNIHTAIKEVEAKERSISLPHKLNILLLGVDERPKENDPGRSDTLLVAMIDTKTREASILSVPRDTRVWIRGYGWDKINHAFMVGGVSVSKKAIEEFLGISVDYYAKVDLSSFGRIVDAFGGINIDVKERMQYVDTWDHYVIDLNPGMQLLDGSSALQYVRYRDEEGDIGRVRRQQQFLKAVMAKMSSATLILKLPAIIREVVSAMETDLPMPLMLGLASQFKQGLSGEIKTHMVEGLPYYINNISFWIPDVMNTRQKVSELQGTPFLGSVYEAALTTADEYRRNLPANAYLDNGTDYAAKPALPVKPGIPPKTATTLQSGADMPKIMPPVQKTPQAMTAPIKMLKAKLPPSVQSKETANSL
jgi:LCP family protein required for cell wall assembly